MKSAKTKRTVREFDRHLDEIEDEQHPEPTTLAELESEFATFTKRKAVSPELAQKYTRVSGRAWRTFAEEILSTVEEGPVPDQGLLNTLKMVRDMYARAGEERLADGSFANAAIERRLTKLAALVPHAHGPVAK